MKNILSTLSIAAMMVSAVFASSCSSNPKTLTLKTEKDSVSYFMGYLSSKNMAGIELNPIAIAKGWQEGVDKVEHKMTDAEMNEFIGKYFEKENERIANDNKEAGEKWLEQNKTKEGVITTESGLQYKVLKEGTGVKPAKDATVKVQYHGTLLDGTVFDSSKERNDTVTFSVAHLIPGFTEALTLMPEGSSWEIYLPSNLAYGEQGAGSMIKPNSALIFQIDLIEVNNPEATEEEKTEGEN